MKNFIALLLSVVLTLAVLQSFGSFVISAEESAVEYDGYVYNITRTAWTSSAYLQPSSTNDYVDSTNKLMSIVIKNLSSEAIEITYSPRNNKGEYLNLSINISPQEIQLIEIPFPTSGSTKNCKLYLYLNSLANYNCETVSLAINVQVTASGDNNSAFSSTSETIKMTPMFKKTVNSNGTYTTTQYGSIWYNYSLTASANTLSNSVKAAAGVGISEENFVVYLRNNGTENFTLTFSPRTSNDGYLFTDVTETNISINQGDTVNLTAPPISASTDYILFFFKSASGVVDFSCNFELEIENSDTQTLTLTSLEQASFDSMDLVYNFDSTGRCDLTIGGDYDFSASGEYAIISDREDKCASVSQNVFDRLDSSQTNSYYFSAQMRLTESSDDEITGEILLDLGSECLNSSKFTLTTEWQQIYAIITPDTAKTWTKGEFAIQTLYKTDNSSALVDVEIDSVYLIPFNDTDTDLFENSAMDSDKYGQITSWGKIYNCNVYSSKVYDFETGSKQDDNSIKYSNGYVPCSDENIVFSGRWISQSHTLPSSTLASKRCGFEGYSQIKFTGTSLYAFGFGEVWAIVDNGTETAFTLNGITMLANGLTEGTHTVRVVAKGQKSNPEIIGYIIDDNASTVSQEDTPVIEFIGDSITDGCTNNIGYLNSYAYLTGKSLGWQYNTVAFGGITATVGTGSDSIGIAARYLKQSEKGSFGENADYDFSGGNAVDFTVINIGTNDASLVVNDEGITNFKDSYRALIQNVYAKHPQTKLIVMIPFNGACKTYIGEVVDEFTAKNITVVDSDTWNVTYNGTDGVQPDASFHTKAAGLLKTIIEHKYDSFAGANVIAGTSFDVNYYAKLINAENAMVQFTHKGITKTVLPVYDETEKLYKFTYSGINSQCMTDNISATLIVDGVICDTKESYSIKENCENLYAGTSSEELKLVLAGILNFGATAQQYMGYKTDNLANSDTDLDYSSLTAIQPDKLQNTVLTAAVDANNKATSAGMIYSTAPKLYFKLKVTDDAKIYLNGEEVTGVSSNGYRYVYTDFIDATEFETVYTLEIKVNVETYNKVQYNVNTYIHNKWNSTDTKLQNLVRALNAYGSASVSYLNALNG